MPNETTTGTATSRARTARRAVRKAGSARLALSGASGSGKTWTALSVAQVLGERVVFIDTEPGDASQSAAQYYSDVFRFDAIEWGEPYDPRDLTLTIKELATLPCPADGFWPGEPGYQVCVVDSGSHFWTGEGGTLDIADGKFSGWKVASPVQQDLVDAILRSPMHMIFCTRAKQAYEVNEVLRDGRTRQEVVKLGMQPIQRADLEYEFQVVVAMDQDHRMEIGKTRCQALAGKSFKADHQGEFAAIYKSWLEAGEVLVRQVDADLIRDALNTVPGDRRAAAKQAWLDEFGHPTYLVEDRVPTAWAWLSSTIGVDPHPFKAEARDHSDDPQSPDFGMPATCVTCGLVEGAGWHTTGVPQEEPQEPPQGPEMGEVPPVPEQDPGPPGEPQAADTGAPQGEPQGEPVEDVPTDQAFTREDYVATLRHLSSAEINEALVDAGLPVNGSKDVRITRLANHVLGA